MQERVKILTFVSGHGETLVDPPHEDHVNQWLLQFKGRLVHVSQTESERTGSGQHATVCIWYLPDEGSTA